MTGAESDTHLRAVRKTRCPYSKCDAILNCADLIRTPHSSYRIAHGWGLEEQERRPLGDSQSDEVAPERAEVGMGEVDEDAQADDELAATFVHPMEEEFARLLDFYHIPWLYEPTSFALNWSGDQVIEMFTPDFYLPD